MLYFHRNSARAEAERFLYQQSEYKLLHRLMFNISSLRPVPPFL